MSRSPYRTLGERLGLPSLLWRLAGGELEVPSSSYGPGAECVNYPPALWPVWEKGEHGVVGLWMHWLVERQPTYVKWDREEPRVTEIARTPEQLVTRAALECWVNSGGDADDLEVRAFAAGAGILDFGELEQLASDDPKKMATLAAFRSNVPLEAAGPAAYAGDFPVIDGPSRTPLHRSCSYEIEPGWVMYEAEEGWRSRPACDRPRPRAGATDFPPWLAEPVRQRPIFDALLARRDLAGAWLCLNSSPWSFSEGRSAFRELAGSAASEELSILAELWCSRPHDDDFEY